MVPTRSDDILVTTTEYNDNGEAYKTIDPADKEDRTEFDDAGRVTKQIENYTDGDPTTGGNDEDITVCFTYTADGQQATITAKQKSSSDDQTTKYIYGTSLSDSDIARSDLLRAVIYPDSDDTGATGVPPVLSDGADSTYDRVEHKYNRQGEITETKDQNETVHAFDHDKLGRQTHDRVTALGTNIDGAVRRISTTYEVRGQVEKITSYDNATVGSGSVVNEVLREYNDAGLLDKEYQEHDGAKDANTLYVGYNYDTTASGGEFSKGLRQTSIRYPDGRLVHYTYGSSGSDADNLNRLDAIKDDNGGSPGDTLASYTYLGLGQMVIEDYEEPEVKLDYFGGTSGTYAGFDRFDRITDQRWHDYGASEDRDRFKYGYDRASNRTWKENVVSKSLPTPVYLDEFYTYDRMYRLETFDRGELNIPHSAIPNPQSSEDWTLDPLGNWSNYIQKTDGTTDLEQDRTVNKANEITDITETTGTSWPAPSYDLAGNAATVPQPDDLANSLDLTWDGWNRLVKVEEGTTTVAEYGYDGAKRRLTADVDSTVVHFLYTFRWQIIEQHLDSSPDPERQFIWGPFYIDHLILRDRDNSNPANGTVDERIYSLQDEGWNVSSLTDANGNEIERVTYAPYGAASYFNGDWSSTSNDSQFDFTNSFGGIEVDSETRLYHFRNRYRHAELGLWITRDPLFYLDAPHLYLTARSNPIRLMDPMGLQAARPKTCTAKTCEECVDSGWKNHEVLAKLRSRMTRTLGWRKGCKPNIVCCDRDDKRAECEPCDVPRKFGNLKIGTQNISICAFRVLDYSGVRGSKRGKCTHLWETIAHELIHLHDQCLNFNRIPKDKCAQCVCDEIHAYTWSGQCISGSGDNPQGVWYEINRFSSVEECVIKSVIGSCDAFCVFVGKTDKEKEAIVRKYIENKTCRRSPLGEELP